MIGIPSPSRREVVYPGLSGTGHSPPGRTLCRTRLPDIARKFATAVRRSIDALVVMPSAGAPVSSSNPALAGLRTWPVSHFDAFRVYHLAQPDLIAVIRLLHGKRDARTILEDQIVEGPR